MKINKAIIEVKKRKNMSYDSMAKALPRKKDGTPKLGKDVSATLVMNDNMSTKTIIPLLDVLGYELIIQEKRAGVRREDQIVITTMDASDLKKGKIKLISDEPTNAIDLDNILNDNSEEE